MHLVEKATVMGPFKSTCLCLFTWAAVVGGGLTALMKYDATPGASANVGSQSALPVEIDSTSGKLTLVMFVHPRCPCSVASIDELSRLMSNLNGRLRAYVVMYQAVGQPQDWSRSTAWRNASGIPGVEVRSDLDAVLAGRSGAQTSGDVYLYDEDRSLLFEGGITGSRGHVGDNSGFNSVTRIVLGKRSSRTPPGHSPVFGCSIYSMLKDEPGSPLMKAKQ
jgi:hypothetical protein